MTQHSGMPDGRWVAIVTVQEGLGLQPEAAFLAGLCEQTGLRPYGIAADFGTPEEYFRSCLAERPPFAVLLPYTTEFREVLIHVADVARRTTGATTLLVGDAVGRERLPEHPIEGVGWIEGAHPSDVIRALGVEPPDLDWSAVPMSFGLLGDDPAGRPPCASLFGEVGVLGLLASREAREGLSPTALLGRLSAPLRNGPILLPPTTAVAPLEGVAGVERVEWWDRAADRRASPSRQHVAAQGLQQSCRVVPTDLRWDWTQLRDDGVDRVVFEADRLDGAEPLPGSVSTVEGLQEPVAQAREAGLSVAILVSVGLPGETVALARERLRSLRLLNPDLIRSVPFEATGGTYAQDWVENRGLAASRTTRWQREVHRPLVQPGLTSDEFFQVWTDLLGYQAELQRRRRVHL